MWIMVLPMLLLVSMAPLMMLNNDAVLQRQQQLAANVVRLIPVQHQAAVQFCRAAATNCRGGGVVEIDVSTNLDPAISLQPGMLRSFWNGTRIVTYLDLNGLSQMRGNLSPGMVMGQWGKLSRTVSGGGMLRGDTFRDYLGSPPVIMTRTDLDLNRAPENLPMMVGS